MTASGFMMKHYYQWMRAMHLGEKRDKFGRIAVLKESTYNLIRLSTRCKSFLPSDLNKIT